MNAKDLRIGNLIEWPTDHLEPGTSFVWPVHSSDFRLIENGHLKPSPVAITEEWLLKFGFEEIKSDWEPDEYVLRKPDSIERLFTLKRWKESFFYIEQGNVIKHVHQLQSLFHALTGQELELKQPAQ